MSKTSDNNDTSNIATLEDHHTLADSRCAAHQVG
jgi:hypothetical protein